MDNVPGHGPLSETEEVALWAQGPNGQTFHKLEKAGIKSTVTDSGNTGFTTTLRAGKVLARKTSDGLLYAYDADADDGTQNAVGILGRYTPMVGPTGAVADRFTNIYTGGILKATDLLIGSDKAAVARLVRNGMRFGGLDPHGSQFGLHFKGRSFKATDYTVLDADHGWMLVATAAANFTLPTLADVGRGFQVLLFNAADTAMVVTGAANTIVAGDAGGAVSTTITFDTANRRMGASVLMYADYLSDGGALAWYPLFVAGGTPTYA